MTAADRRLAVAHGIVDTGTHERLRSYLEGFVVLSLPDGPSPLHPTEDCCATSECPVVVSAA